MTIPLAANRSLGFSIYALDKASSTFAKIATTVRSLKAQLDRLDRTKVDPEITVRTAQAERQIDRLAAIMRTKLATAARSLDDIEIGLDDGRLNLELIKLRNKIRGINEEIHLGLDPREAISRIDEINRRLRELGNQSTDPKVTADIRQAQQALRGISAEAHRLDQTVVSVPVQATGTQQAARELTFVERIADRLSRLRVRIPVHVDGAGRAAAELTAVKAASDSVAESQGRSLLTTFALIRTFSLLTAVAGLTGPALGVVGGAIAALPAAMFAVLGPAAAIAVGLDGIQAAAAGIMPAFGQMKLAVSQTFQQGLTPMVQQVLPLFPMVTAGLQSIATGLVGMARAQVEVLTSAQAVAQVQQIFANIRSFIDQLSPGLAVVTQNMLTMAAVGGQAFAQLGTVITRAAQQFQGMLAASIQTGQFQAAIAGLVNVLGALFGVLNQTIFVAIQLGATLAGPLVTALQAAGNLIVALGPLAGALGQLFLGLFTAVANALIPVIPMVTALVNSFMPLMPLISQLAALIGGALIQVLSILIPPLQVVINALTHALAPILPQLAAAFGSVVASLGPVVAILGNALAGALHAVAPILGQVATILGNALTAALTIITPLIPPLVASFQQILNALLPLIPQVAALVGQFIVGLAPVLPVIAGLMLQLLNALMPLVAPLVQIAQMLMPVLVQIIQAAVPVVQAFVGALLRILDALSPMIPPLLQLVQTLLPPMLQVTMALMPVLVALANAFAQIVIALMPLLPPLIQIAQFVLPILANSVATAANVLSAVLVPAINFLSTVLSGIITVLSNVIAGIINFVVTAVGWFTSFMGQVGGIWGLITNLVINAWNAIYQVGVTIWNAISAFFAAAFAIYQLLWSNLWRVVTQLFQIAWDTIRNAAMVIWNQMLSFWGPAFSFFQNLWNTIWGAIRDAFSQAWALIRGTAITVWNAIVAFLQPAITAFQNVWNFVWNAMSLVWGMIWNTIRSTAIAVWTVISTFFQTALTIFQTFWNFVWNAVSTAFSNIWNRIYGFAMQIWNVIYAFFTVALTIFQTFWGAVWNAISNFFSGIWNRIWGQVQFFWNIIKAFYNAALAQFQAFWGNIWNNIVSTFDRIWSTISGIAQRVWDNVKGVFRNSINGVIDLINVFAGAVSRIAGLLGFNIDLRINRLGEGGPVTGGGPTGGVTFANPGAVGGAALGRADGGTIERREVIRRAGGGGINAATGGKLPSTGKSYDSLPALAGQQRYMLMGDEWVINRASSRALGSATMAAINNAHRNPVDVIPRAKGGPVVGEQTARRHAPFLNAVADGQAEAAGAVAAMGGPARMLAALERGSEKARQTAGGRGATMPGYRSRNLDVVNRDLGGAINVARSMHGKPYIWGGAGPGGADCSGYQSIITNALRNQAPFRRIGTTATFPWGGFRSGLTSRYGVGAFKGNPGHMAGTLNGVNVEAGGSPSRVKYGAGAVGADHGQFRIRASLPEVGGVFASGGGGGGGINLHLRRKALDAINWALGDPHGRMRAMRDNPANAYGMRAGGGGGVKLIEWVYAKADAADAADASAGGGGMDTSGISGPVVDQVRQVAARFGWDREPFWGAIVRLVQKESGWNPNAANPTSSARGLFQKMTSLHGPVEPTPAGQAAWGLNYIRGRYGDPVRALDFHNRNNHYDSGGWLEPGYNLAYNGTGHREPILPLAPGEWRDMVRGQTGGRAGSGDEYDKLARVIAAELRGDRSLIGSLTVQAPQGASASDVAREVSHTLRLTRMGGVHR